MAYAVLPDGPCPIVVGPCGAEAPPPVAAVSVASMAIESLPDALPPCGAPAPVSIPLQWAAIKYGGGSYVGQVNRDLLPHGNGKLTFVGGSYYEGQWENGKKHGRGTSVEVSELSKGKFTEHIFDGEWANDEIQGQLRAVGTRTTEIETTSRNADGCCVVT